MLPLVGLAATFVPELIRLIAGDTAGTVAAQVSQAVTDVTKTSDPVEALKALQADASAAADLRARLAQIAVDAQKAQNDEADKKRQDELAAIQANIANTTNARSSMLALTQAKSWIAWAAPAVSLVVTIGFFAILALILHESNEPPGTNSDFQQLLYVSVGTLGTAFATVVNFWLGSSQGSRDKDVAALQAQSTHADQISQAMDTVKSVAADAVGAMSAPAKTVAAVVPAKPDNFDRCMTVVLANEGGFVENAADPGGATNFGITKRTLEAFVGHPVSIDDVKNLSSNTAIEIYRSNYWNMMLCDSLPSGVDLMVFDYGVNSGPGQAVKTLQKLVGVNQDGAMGKITLPAVAKASPKNLINELATARMQFLQGLPTFAQFGAGWTRRVNDVQQKALTMAGAV
jgi:Glycosyl hydrolase 108/Predicted Peptidoglycan domain